MLLAVCIMMTALSYAHGLSTELFGTRYADALRNIESILGKPAKAVSYTHLDVYKRQDSINR